MIKKFSDFCRDQERNIESNSVRDSRRTMKESKDTEFSDVEEIPSEIEVKSEDSEKIEKPSELLPDEEAQLPDLSDFLEFVKKSSINHKIGKKELKNLYLTKYGTDASDEFLQNASTGLIASFDPSRLDESIGDDILLDESGVLEAFKKFLKDKNLKDDEILNRIQELVKDSTIRFSSLRDLLISSLSEEIAFEFFSELLKTDVRVSSKVVKADENLSSDENVKKPEESISERDVFLRQELIQFISSIPERVLKPSEKEMLSEAIENLPLTDGFLMKADIVKLLLEKLNQTAAFKILRFLEI